MDPQSPLRQASRPAKEDMARDWNEGNYFRWLGDAGRAMLATGAHVASEALMPTPIFGQNGILQGLVNGEYPEERAARLAAEERAQIRPQASTPAAQVAHDGSTPSALHPMAADQPPPGYMPVNVAHALGYTIPSPKALSVNDIITQLMANEEITRHNRAIKALGPNPDPKLFQAEQDKFVTNLGVTRRPQDNLILGGYGSPSQ
jgi:hypothetical protein